MIVEYKLRNGQLAPKKRSFFRNAAERLSIQGQQAISQVRLGKKDTQSQQDIAPTQTGAFNTKVLFIGGGIMVVVLAGVIIATRKSKNK